MMTMRVEDEPVNGDEMVNARDRAPSSSRGLALAQQAHAVNQALQVNSSEPAGSGKLLMGLPLEWRKRIHDMRAPALGLRAFLSMMRETTLSQEQRRYLEMMEQTATTLLGLSGGLFVGEQSRCLPKDSLNSLKLENIPFHLRRSFLAWLTPIQLACEEKGLYFQCRVAPNVPNNLMGHPLEMERIVVNLLKNAVKCTEKGGVSVFISMNEKEAQTIQNGQNLEGSFLLNCLVEDTGCGMPLEKQMELMSPGFSQPKPSVEGAHLDEATGGLGLPIVCELVHQIGGALSVVSPLTQRPLAPVEGSSEEIPNSSGPGTRVSLRLPVSVSVYLAPHVNDAEEKTVEPAFLGKAVKFLGFSKERETQLLSLFTLLGFEPVVIETLEARFAHQQPDSSCGGPIALLVIAEECAALDEVCILRQQATVVLWVRDGLFLNQTQAMAPEDLMLMSPFSLQELHFCLKASRLFQAASEERMEPPRVVLIEDSDLQAECLMRTLEKTAGVPMACQHRLKETSSLNAWLLQIHGRDKDWPDFILLDQYLGADATVPLLDAFWKTLEYSASLRLGFCPVFLLSATGVSATADNPLPPAWVWGVFQKPLPDSEILTSLRPYWDRTWQHQAQQQRLSNLRGTTGIQDEAALRRFMMKMAHKLGDLRLQVYHALKAIQQDGPDVTEPWGRLKHGLHEMKGTVGLGGVGGTLYAFLSEWENALQVERSFRAGRGAVLRERQPECESEPMTFCVQTFWQDLNRHLGPYCLNLAKQGL